MNRDYSEMFAALSAAGAEFLVVGAYAMAAHGYPRATGDIDIWVHATPENAARGVADLIRNKSATGRPKDQADLAWLQQRAKS